MATGGRTSTADRVLVKGYGNPAREDDGLGPAIVESIDALALRGVRVEADYQLTVEDAATVAAFDIVVFVDASATGEEPFVFSPLRADDAWDLSSHSVGPAAVLSLARDLFHSEPRAFLLGVRGYSFAPFTERMSDAARKNGESACGFLVHFLEKGIEE